MEVGDGEVDQHLQPHASKRQSSRRRSSRHSKSETSAEHGEGEGEEEGDDKGKGKGKAEEPVTPKEQVRGRKRALSKSSGASDDVCLVCIVNCCFCVFVSSAVCRFSLSRLVWRREGIGEAWWVCARGGGGGLTPKEHLCGMKRAHSKVVLRYDVCDARVYCGPPLRLVGSLLIG